MTTIFDWDPMDTDIPTAVGEAIGAAAFCWSPLPSTAVFDSARAEAIMEELLTFLQAKSVGLS